MPTDRAAGTDSDLPQVLAGLALAVVLTLMVLTGDHGRSWSTGFFLVLLSVLAGGVLWWGISILRSNLPRGRKYGGSMVGAAAVLAIAIISLSTSDDGPVGSTTPQDDLSAEFGVQVAGELTTVPTLRTTDEPTIDVVNVADAVAVPIVKVAIDGPSGRFLIRSDAECRVVSVLLGPPAGGAVPALVAVAPRPAAGNTGGEPAGSCGTGGATLAFQVVDVALPKAEITSVTDVGANGPASLVDG